MVRQKTVAVAVIYDKSADKYLLWNNPRWRAYAFPMKGFEPSSGVSPATIALNAVQEVLELPAATAEPLDRVGNVIFSEGVREYTFYDYFVFGINPNQAIKPHTLDPDLKFFSFDELQMAFHVSESTQLIASSLVEDRNVAVAVISRTVGGRTEFLLVQNGNRQYFFPATRLKMTLFPAEAAIAAVRNDLGYDGEVEIVDQTEVQDVQASIRFGPRSVSFNFHCCAVALPGVDLAVPGNPLERSLALQASLVAPGPSAATTSNVRWFNEEQMRSGSDMSPSVKSILSTVLQLAAKHK